MHHWELERYTGLKHQDNPFFSEKDFINVLLKEYDLTINDINKIIGMYKREVDMCNELSYHSLCHLYASIFIDSEAFYSGNILALSVDGGPDFLFEEDYGKKKCYVGAYYQKGNIEFFDIASPGMLWGQQIV